MMTNLSPETRTALATSILTDRVYRGERVEINGYWIVATLNRGGDNINKMLASVGDLATGAVVASMVPVEDTVAEFVRRIGQPGVDQV